MKDVIVYISGPMTGLPRNNFPAFNEAAQELRQRGFKVLNPAEMNADRPERAVCMRRDIDALLLADVLFWLQGAHGSPGAKLEMAIANEIGVTCMPFWYGKVLPKFLFRRPASKPEVRT